MGEKRRQARRRQKVLAPAPKSVSPWTIVRVVLVSIALAMYVCWTSGCSPRIVEHIIVQHDTTRVVKIDSIWQYQKDSVYVMVKGDTVTQYVERIRYRDRFKIDTLVKVREVHDTTSVEVEVEKSLSWAQKTKIGAFWWLLACLAASLIYIFRKPILNLVKVMVLRA